MGFLKKLTKAIGKVDPVGRKLMKVDPLARKLVGGGGKKASPTAAGKGELVKVKNGFAGPTRKASALGRDTGTLGGAAPFAGSRSGIGRLQKSGMKFNKR